MTEFPAAPVGHVRWSSVATFYALACAISWPLFWWRWTDPAGFAAWRPPVPRHVLYMSGPAIAALVCLRIFRSTHSRTVTLLGSSVLRSLAFWVVPAAILAAAYATELHRDDGWDRWFGLVTIGFVATLGEEFGWRGFLQDALRPLSRVRRYLLLGGMWEAWHFTTRWSDGHVGGAAARVALAAAVLIVLSWAFGELVDRTRSVLVAVTLHAWFNLAFEASSALPGSPIRAGCALVASSGFWWWIVRSWPQPPRHEGGADARASTPRRT